MSLRSDILPEALPPVGISREQAATLVGIGVTLFDQLVASGAMPQPRLLGKRLIWDVAEIVHAFRALPHREAELDGIPQDINPWDHD